MMTYDKKRIVAAVFLVLIVAATANWHFGFIFPRYSRFMLALIVLAVAIWVSRLTPAQLGQDRPRKQDDD